MMLPEFCSNLNCKNHLKGLNNKKWYKKAGFYYTVLNGSIQRFKCTTCGKTFSEQTFSVSYYEKKDLNYIQIMTLLCESMSLSGISRVMMTSIDSISIRIDKIARQILVYHERLKDHIVLNEDLVADGFESFVRSQYFPNNIHFLAGKESQYLYYMNYVLIKRKGRMTNFQKEKREKLYKNVEFKKGSLTRSFNLVVDEVTELVNVNKERHIVFITDKKKEYDTACKNNKRFKSLLSKGLCSRKTISSRLKRNLSNDLFSPNYLDREVRKDQANHRRETTCFARNVSSCLNRMVIYFFNHNYIKDYRVGKKEFRGISHAEVAGIPRNAIKEVLQKIFSERVFISLEKVKTFAKELWLKKIVTPLKIEEEYLPAYASM